MTIVLGYKERTMNNIALKKEVRKDVQENEIVLKLRDISKIYPGTVALYKVNMEIRRGEVHGIIGKNGAGKSTLVGVISGLVEPTSGEINIGGRRYESLSRITAKQERISIVPQEPQVILDLSVAENLFLGDYGSQGRIVNWKDLYAKAEQVIKRAKLNIDVRKKARDLSLSEQQLLLVLKACYVDDAQLVILDEASASLSQDDEKILHQIIKERKNEGNTIIFISHRTDELLKVCDWVTVIRDGKSVGSHSCDKLNKETLSSLIVGEGYKSMAIEEMQEKDSERIGEVVLSVEGLTKLPQYKNINFTLRKGEIVGLAGLRGSGRTEIFKGIAGIDPVDEGSVSIGGIKTRFTNPSDALKHGIVYLPEDREKEGLISSQTVKQNLVLNALHKVSKNLIINKTSEHEFATDLVNALGVKIASVEQEVSQLSGGNKQKVVVGRISAADPIVLLLDECTRGVDIAAKESILSIVRNSLTRSAGIIMSSPGLEELMMICDRILILYQGEIVAEFSRDEFDERTLYMAMQDGCRRQKGSN